MDNHLAPTYQYLLGDHWVLWYRKSNCYNVVDKNFKLHLDYYFEATTHSEFETFVENKDANAIAKAIHTYLEACNATLASTDSDDIPNVSDKRQLAGQYAFNGHHFTIYYDSALVKKTVHPSIAHLEIDESHSAETIFDLYLDGDDLFLFKNNTLLIKVPKKDYHKLQGKFMLHLFCSVHQKHKEDWIGTLHGSTITDGTSAVMFIGASGRGKSTLTTILAAHGYQVVADDISPILALDQQVYLNPAAVSVKKGAFEVLQPLISNFNDYETLELNAAKGAIKYIPFPKPNNSHYPCKTMVLVNYKKEAETVLEPIPIITVLKTLIPDSWISEDPTHARQFIEWLTTVTFYELTYADTKHAIGRMDALFKAQPDDNNLIS